MDLSVISWMFKGVGTLFVDKLIFKDKDSGQSIKIENSQFYIDNAIFDESLFQNPTEDQRTREIGGNFLKYIAGFIDEKELSMHGRVIIIDENVFFTEGRDVKIEAATLRIRVLILSLITGIVFLYISWIWFLFDRENGTLCLNGCFLIFTIVIPILITSFVKLNRRIKHQVRINLNSGLIISSSKEYKDKNLNLVNIDQNPIYVSSENKFCQLDFKHGEVGLLKLTDYRDEKDLEYLKNLIQTIKDNYINKEKKEFPEIRL